MNRALRTKEKRIHRHLYLAMLIQVVIRLILYVDQLVSRSNGAIGDLKVRREAEVEAAGDAADLVRGIDNTVRRNNCTGLVLQVVKWSFTAVSYGLQLTQPVD